ncbi:acyltransferase family protein [Rhizobium sp. KDH_Rht_773_N]
MNSAHVDSFARQEERLHVLDGMRGWGAIFVLFFHVFCEGLPVTAESGAYLRRLLPFSGLYAVLVFFVVSGISLSYGYFRERNVEKLIAAAGSRYFRLAIPIFVVAVAVHLAMIAGLHSLSKERIAPFSNALSFQSTIENVLRFSFFDVFFNYNPGLTYAGPMWTMSVELIGSFLLFAVLLLSCRSAYYLAIISAVSFILMFSVTQVFKFYSLLLFGAMIAGLIHRGYAKDISPWLFAGMLAIGISAPAYLPPAYDAWNMLATVALTLGCIGIKPVNSFLSCQFSKLLGIISFPLYLVHGPILVLIGEPLVHNFGGTAQSKFAIDVGICVISVLVALPMIPVNRLAIQISRFFGRQAVYSYNRVRIQLAPSQN